MHLWEEAALLGPVRFSELLWDLAAHDPPASTHTCILVNDPEGLWDAHVVSLH